MSSDARTNRSERKLLTLLFADLSGYTDLTTSSDPEVVDDLVEPLLAQLTAIALDHGAEVRQPQGDGFLAVFGARRSRDDDPRRAVTAGERMVESIAARTDSGRRALDVHVGIATGEVLVRGEVESGSLTGAAVNLAARLSDKARAGQVLVDEVCAKLCASESWFALPVALQLQGFPEPVRTRALLGTATERTPPTRIIVGREVELEALDDAWTDVLTGGRSRVLVLRGEAGIGKTTLVEAWVAQQRVAVFRGQCRDYGSSRPYSAITEAVLDWGGGPDELVRRCGASPAGEAARRFADAVQLPTASLGPMPRLERHELASLLRDLLQHIAADRPLIVALEDVHDAPDDVLEMIADLTDRPLLAPLLLLLTSRNEASGDRVLVIPPLDSSRARELLERHGPLVEEERLERVLERSGGNPLWLVELAALLGSSDDADVAQKGVPDTLRLALSARVDGLAEPLKEVLKKTSVAPEGLPRHALTGEENKLVDRLVEERLLEVGPLGELVFHHQLFREVVYESVPRSDRVAWHRKLRDDGQDLAARAHHAAQAWRLTPELDPLRAALASEVAEDLMRLVESLHRTSASAALWTLGRAADVVNGVVEARVAVAVDLLRVQAECLLDLERRSEALASIDRAADLADVGSPPSSTALLAITRGWILCAEGNVEEAARVARRLLGSPGLSAGSRAAALALLARTLADDTPADLVVFEQAYAAYSEAEDREGAASMAQTLAWLLSVSTTRTYQFWLERAVERTHTTNPRGQASLARTRAIAASVRREWKECVTQAEQARSLACSLGAVDLQIWCLLMLTEAHSELGDLEVADVLCAELARLTVGARTRQRLNALGAVLPVMLRRGEGSAARAVRADIESLLSELGPAERAWISQVDGMLAADRGDYETALEPWEAAEKESASLGWVLHAAQSRLGRLTALYRLGDPTAVPGLLELADLYDGEQAPAAARLARAVAGHPEPGEPATPAETAWIAEHAARRYPSPEAWQRAADAWAVLGLSEALAVCLDEAGQTDEAEDVRRRLSS